MKIDAKNASAVAPSAEVEPVPTLPATKTSSPLATPLSPTPATIVVPANVTPTALAGRVAPSLAPPTRYTLQDAVDDPACVAKDPATLPVPAEMLELITKAKTVLLVGHIAPDGDCVGSTLSMQRALESLGKTCDVCVDDALAGSLRRIDSEARVQRAAALDGKSWDLALIMDVAVPERIGGALGLLKNASAVAIADHHVADPKRADFHVPEDKPFATWVEPDYPCAALCGAAIIGRLGAATPNVIMPALCSFATDTGWGTYEGTDRSTFRYFKHMLKETAKTDLAGVKAALDYALPVALTQELATSNADGISERIIAGPGGGLGLLTLTQERLDRLLAGARKEDPRLIEMDVTNVLKWGRSNDQRKRGADLTAFLHEQDGYVFCSFRGKGDLPLRCAQSIGGGGHEQAAGARVKASLADVEAKIIAFAKGEGVVS